VLQLSTENIVEETDLVSVVTPAYNSAASITQTIRSVQTQTYKNWDMIIVDDGSNDNTHEVVEECGRADDRISLIRFHRNQGAAAGRNAGIEAAGGRYIAFLDSDDLWLPDKLEKQTAFMRNRECVLSYTAYKKIDDDGNVISDAITVPATVTYQKLLLTNVIGCLTAMYDSRVLGKVYAPTAVKRQEDYCLWLKILKMGYEARGLNEPLALYRVRSRSASRNKAKVAFHQWKVYREVERLSLIKSISCFLRYAYHGYRKLKM
jgi:teichuronic acid biosynthesis glycosyltransferase TuaG